MSIEQRIADMELDARVHSMRTMAQFYRFQCGHRREARVWEWRLLGLKFQRVMVRLARSAVNVAQALSHLGEVIVMEDDCAECGHDFDAHRYLNTPTLECSFDGCDCASYVNPDEVD